MVESELGLKIVKFFCLIWSRFKSWMIYLMTGKLEFTLEQYKSAGQRFAAGELSSLSKDELKLLSSVIIKDIERREKRLAKQQEKLISVDLPQTGGDQNNGSASKHILDGNAAADNKSTKTEKNPRPAEKPKRNKRRHDKEQHHPLNNFTPGETCPRCGGSLYQHVSQVMIRIVCNKPLERERHVCESAQCKSCGFKRTADPGFNPEHLVRQFSPQAAALLAVCHYYLGMAFKRFETLMKYFDKNFSASTQWDVVSEVYDRLQPLFVSLALHAKETAKNIRIDDAGAKILYYSRDGTTRSPNTTAIYFELPYGRHVSLFYTGAHHGGDVSDALAKQRKNAERLVRVSDAASKNFAGNEANSFIDACCNEHAFAYFRKIRENHPESYEVVAEVYGNVYENDSYCKQNDFSDVERLAYHQKHSRPEMVRLRLWAATKLKEQFIENNSDEGKALNYLANQFMKLTEFLRTPGVPLDTNRVEQFLRVSKRYFKNSSFYKTETGAEVGDGLMSLIRTAIDAKVSPIAYLTWCLENYRDLKQHPHRYFPWEFAKLVETAEAA